MRNSAVYISFVALACISTGLVFLRKKNGETNRVTGSMPDIEMIFMAGDTFETGDSSGKEDKNYRSRYAVMIVGGMNVL